MNERNQSDIHAQMQHLAKSFPYVYELGVTIEINEFLYDAQVAGKVKDFVLLFNQETNRYKAKVQMEETSLASVHHLFLSLFRFVVYSNVALFMSQKTEQGYHYEMASFTEEERGFFVRSIFGPKLKGERKRERDRIPPI